MGHGFDGVVDEVAEGALHGFGVGEDEGECGGQGAGEMDGFSAAGEEGKGVFNEGVEVRGAGLGGGELGEGGELVYQLAHGFYRGRDDFRAAADDGDGGGLNQGFEAVDVAVDLFCREGDGGEGVFDFVGYAAGYFFPGGLLLGAEELGGVFKDEDVAEVGAG